MRNQRKNLDLLLTTNVGPKKTKKTELFKKNKKNKKKSREKIEYNYIEDPVQANKITHGHQNRPLNIFGAPQKPVKKKERKMQKTRTITLPLPSTIHPAHKLPSIQEIEEDSKKPDPEFEEKYYQICKINKSIKNFNLLDYDIKKLTTNKEAVRPIYFSSNLVFTIRMFILQTVFAALPLSPAFQLLFLSTLECFYLALNFYIFKFAKIFIHWFAFLLRFTQSLTLLAIYFTFYLILLRNRAVNFNTIGLQRTAIWTIWAGFLIDLTFNLISGVIKMITIWKERKKKKGKNKLMD